MAQQSGKGFMKAILVAFSVIYLLFGLTIFSLDLTNYVTPLLLLSASAVMLFHLVVKRSVNTFKEVGVPEFAFALVAILTGVAGIFGFFLTNVPTLATIGSVGMIIAAITLFGEAVSI